MSAPARIAAWLALTRASNLPTVWTNGLVGLALAGGGMAGHLRPLLLGLMALSLLYTAGMALNDWCDAAVDQQERPGRPIPSGRITSRSAGWFTLAAMVLAWLLLGLTGTHALALGLALSGLILLYNLTHLHTASSVVAMGLCRGMVYLVMLAALQPQTWEWARSPWPWAVALGMSGYIVLLSVLARSEAQHPARQRVVIGLIRAICLVDAAWLMALGQPRLALGAVCLWLITRLWQRWIPAT